MRKTLQLILLILAQSALAQVDLTSDLRLCMNCNGNAQDASGFNNHGMVSGAVLTNDKNGNSSSAYLFNGTSDYINVGNLSLYAPTDELTIIMWAQSNLTTSNCLFIINPDNMFDRCVGCAQYIHPNGTMMIWDYGDITDGDRTVKQNLPTDLTGWHQYAFVISQSCDLKEMYMDASIQVSASSAGNGISNKNKPLYIGGGWSDGGGHIRWHGKIDNVMIYNRALKAAEILALYNDPEVCNKAGKTSDTRSTSPCQPAGVIELQPSGKILLYPAYSQGAISINENIESLKIYGADGRLVRSYDHLQAGTIETGLEPGLYHAIVLNGRAWTQKIIIGD